MDADVCAIGAPGAISAPDGVISAPGAISTPDGVLSTPGAISAPEDERLVTAEETLGIIRGDARVVSKEEGEGGDTSKTIEHLPDLVELIEDEAENDGYIDRLSHMIVREQRIAKAHQVLGFSKKHVERGDQADQAAA